MDALARHRMLLLAGVPVPAMAVPARVEVRNEVEGYDEPDEDLNDELEDEEDVDADDGEELEEEDDLADEPDDSPAMLRHRTLQMLGIELRARSNPAPGRQVLTPAGSKRFKLPIGATILPNGKVLFGGRTMDRDEATQIYLGENPDAAPAKKATPAKVAKKTAPPGVDRDDPLAGLTPAELREIAEDLNVTLPRESKTAAQRRRHIETSLRDHQRRTGYAGGKDYLARMAEAVQQLRERQSRQRDSAPAKAAKKATPRKAPAKAATAEPAPESTPVEAPPRVDGRDLTAELDAARIVDLPRTERFSEILRQQGFDAPPAVADSRGVDEAIDAGGIELFRGSTPERARELISGDLGAAAASMGDAAFGTGIYTGGRAVAERFAVEGGLTRMVLRSDARVIAMEDLRASRERLAPSWTDEQSVIFLDQGVLAAALGYDAIAYGQGPLPERNFIVLNRSALTVERTPVLSTAEIGKLSPKALREYAASRAVEVPPGARKAEIIAALTAPRASRAPAPDAATPATPASPPAPASDRQARIDAARAVAEALSELDEIADMPADALDVRIRARSRSGGLSQAQVMQLTAAAQSGDRDRLNAVVDEIATAAGLVRVSGRAGEVEPFQVGTHRNIGGGDPRGKFVRIIRPAYALEGVERQPFDTGTGPLVIVKADVQEADEAASAQALARQVAQRQGDSPVHALRDIATADLMFATKRARLDRALPDSAADLRRIAEDGGWARVLTGHSGGAAGLKARLIDAIIDNPDGTNPRVAPRPRTVTAPRVTGAEIDRDKHQDGDRLAAFAVKPGDEVQVDGRWVKVGERVIFGGSVRIRDESGVEILSLRPEWGVPVRKAPEVPEEPEPTPAPAENLNAMTVANLRARAEALGIRIPSGARKADIIRLLGGTPTTPAQRSRMLALLGVEHRADVTPKPGDNNLRDYWVYGKGRAKWNTFTELRRHLLEHVGPERADRIAAEWFKIRFGFWPGDDRNRVRQGKPPRGERIGPG